MARLVALIDSIRPTVRRVTPILAAAASTMISTTTANPADPDLRHEAIEIADVAADQQPVAIRQGLRSRRAPARFLEADCGSAPRNSAQPCVAASGGHCRRFPARHCGAGAGQQIDMIGKALVGNALRDQGRQPVAAGPRIGLIEVTPLDHDDAIGPIPHIDSVDQ